MHDLDEKRTKTLEKCFESVKVNLSKIFNDLLPGATAHITLMDERDVTKGA
jgi:chromosome segregation ATPase